ncbi:MULTISPECIES: (2Fe-2S) ferredoxin domain-containing protein [unclassified Cyanobium]|uniref:(2Fe-2S) ferredoxin domain-containing protein n=1 Tax=unclassified Cyanobium TaxID=2627006 RepID=UPI0020CEC09E|nr:MULTISPECIES: (2Fe-2S) ferredoxin domain-containing protein [unclassified Cyanobium]
MAVTAPLRWRCCDATACRAAGSAALRQRLEAEVGADRVKPVGCPLARWPSAPTATWCNRSNFPAATSAAWR